MRPCTLGARQASSLHAHLKSRWTRVAAAAAEGPAVIAVEGHSAEAHVRPI